MDRSGSAGQDLVLALAIVAALALVALATRSPPVSGHPRVVDGDTIELDGHRIRLIGMDAPELHQTCRQGGGGATYACGVEARAALSGLVGPALVDCRRLERDRYGRDLSVCTCEGRDLGREMVVRGMAVAYGRYEAEEREAAAAGRGLWSGSFMRPSEWRTQAEERPATLSDVR